MKICDQIRQLMLWDLNWEYWDSPETQEHYGCYAYGAGHNKKFYIITKSQTSFMLFFNKPVYGFSIYDEETSERLYYCQSMEYKKLYDYAKNGHEKTIFQSNPT